MPLILGLASSHDASACVFRDGELLSAVSQERVTRRKNDGYRLPLKAMQHALDAAGVDRGDVDAVAQMHSFFPEEYFRRESLGKEIEARFVRARKRWAGKEERYLNVNDLLRHASARGRDIRPYFRAAPFLARLGLRPGTHVAFFDHHAAHAAAAVHYSGFDACAVITIDGVGELDVHYTAGTLAHGRLERLVQSARLGTSPGEYYEAITEALGFIPLRHEGKVLGLAAHGDPQALYAQFARALRPAPDLRGFDSDFAGRPDAGAARKSYLEDLARRHPREQVAAGAQRVFEDAVLAVVRDFLERTGMRRLAVNGGVFANVRLNQRIAALEGVDELFVFPGMSDAGNSVGAAILLLDALAPGSVARRAGSLRDVYWGSGWSEQACREALQAAGVEFDRLDEPALVARAASAIHAGMVVGWFQGRMEFGPRALGNRSMLARATESSINTTLNARLERTEFMPFAPSVLAEHVDEVFADVAGSAACLPFMTITCNVRAGWRERIPAVVHVDGTARPQAVARAANPLFWSLIEAYRQRSGIPLVLNTSFNVHEEPIVCFPANAVRALKDDRIDCLALGPFWAER